jgi:hypothetical protein
VESPGPGRVATAGSGSTRRASESRRGSPSTVATMRPFHTSKPEIRTRDPPHGPRRNRESPFATGARAEIASRAAARLAGVATGASMRPMSTSMRFPRAAATKAGRRRGANTRSCARLSAAGDNDGRATARPATLIRDSGPGDVCACTGSACSASVSGMRERWRRIGIRDTGYGIRETGYGIRDVEGRVLAAGINRRG